MVLVTGASGLLGSCLVGKLLAEGVPVRCALRSPENPGLLKPFINQVETVGADILDMPAMLKAVEGVDAVIHTAAIVSFSLKNKNLLYETNVQGTANVVNACLRNGVGRLIHVSSVAALGQQQPNSVVNENAKWLPERNRIGYGESKYFGELEVFRGMEEGLHVSVVNPSVILGAGNGTRSTSQLFAYAWQERLFYSTHSINYVDVRDVANIILKLYRGNFNGKRFIASAGSIKLKELLTEVATRFGKRPPRIPLNSFVVNAAAIMEQWRAELAGTEPMVSRQSVRLASENLVYENSQVRKTLAFEFQTLSNTLDWCCREFAANNTNK